MAPAFNARSLMASWSALATVALAGRGNPRRIPSAKSVHVQPRGRAEARLPSPGLERSGFPVDVSHAGASFTFLALLTGSLWGRPMWGTYWEWDARLTSVLILLLMYLGLMALWRAVEDPSRAARAAAMLTLVGAINLPVIKFSVDWWNTLHQPASVLRMGGPTLDRTFLIPLLVMASGFTLLFVTLHVAAIRNEILRRRVRTLQMMQARASSSDRSAASPASQPA
jgi:heme exporter protein C